MWIFCKGNRAAARREVVTLPDQLKNVLCVVTLSVYPTPGKLKNQPDHGGNRTRDLWFASPMLYQLSYEVKSVRVFDISELSLAPSISVCF